MLKLWPELMGLVAIWRGSPYTSGAGSAFPGLLFTGETKIDMSEVPPDIPLSFVASRDAQLEEGIPMGFIVPDIDVRDRQIYRVRITLHEQMVLTGLHLSLEGFNHVEKRIATRRRGVWLCSADCPRPTDGSSYTVATVWRANTAIQMATLGVDWTLKEEK